MAARSGIVNKFGGGVAVWNPEPSGHIFIWSMNDNGWRTVNLNTVIRFKCGDVEVKFKE